MFRRRSSSHHAPLNTSPSPSAQTAAAQAFLASQSSNASLSSAAAAAALRSHTPTPTPIENVQTRRMVQRQSSTSSHGSAALSLRGSKKGLQRAPSSGSMSERTFRDPSPGRPGSSGSPAARIQPQSQAPPLPRLPTQYTAPTTPVRRRAASSEPVQRPMSPPVPSPASQRASRLGSVAEAGRPDSRNSINFSYPRNSATNSPPPSPLSSEFTDSPSGIRVPANDMMARGCEVGAATETQKAVQQASSKPVKKKKKRVPTEGSHLVNGGMGGKPTGTAVDALREQSQQQTQETRREPLGPAFAPQPSPQEQTQPKRRKKKKVTVPKTTEPATLKVETDTQTLVDPASQIAHVERDRPEPELPTAKSKPKKRPSVVHEDPEAEKQAEAEFPTPADTSYAGAARSHVDTSSDFESARQASKILTRGIQENPGNLSSSNSSPIAAYSTTTTADPDKLAVSGSGMEQTNGRAHSISPSRATRFSTTLAVSTGEGLHEPPPRSMSPAKPALKHSNSRSLTPDGVTGRPGGISSDLSDMASVASDDGSRTGNRKKAAKVSFDDEAEVVGVAASPPSTPDSLPISPLGKSTGKHSWFSLGRKKNRPSDITVDEFDEVMKPRPALPSFGSVRNRREWAEEPAADPPSADSSPVSLTSNPATMETSMSSDHAIGGILQKSTELKDLSSSGLSRQPVPPVVTSVDEMGSDTDSVSSVDEDIVKETEISGMGLPGETQEHDLNHRIPKEGEGLHELSESISVPEDAIAAHTSDDVPIIALQPPTPKQEDRNSGEWQGMPGGFPTGFGIPEGKEREISADHAAVEESAAPPESGTNNAQSSVVSSTERTPTITFADDVEESSDSGESIYSDAAEDPEELEAFGFGSINAIVDSPVRSLTGGSVSTPPDSPIRSNLEKRFGQEPPPDSAGREPVTQSTEKPAISELSPPTKPKTKRKKKKATPKSSPLQERPTAQPTGPARGADDEKLPFTSAYPPWPLQHHGSSAGRGRSLNVRDVHGLPRSMRPISASPYDEYQMQKTLRSPDGKPQAPRPSEAAALSQVGTKHKKLSRPMSEGRTPNSKTNETASVPPSKTYSDALRRTTSNGSDSSSSFKRARRSPPTGGRYTMRRSMRSSSDGRPQSPDGEAGSLRVRSFSPPNGSISSGTMRMTMRSPVTGPSLRQNASRGQKSALASFGKKDKKGGAKSSGSRFSSRFNDSSDEEESSRPRMFYSRFDDSSDDEVDAKHLRPVRGIPRRKGADDGDSTDLADSSDDETGVPSTGQTQRPASKRGLAAAANIGSKPNGAENHKVDDLDDLLRTFEAKETKTGLFSRFRRKKKSSSSSDKVRKSDLDSPARRDTVLERSRAELDWTRNNSPSNAKLHKRSSAPVGSQYDSDSWPLRSFAPPIQPSPIPEETPVETERPHTSDGVPEHTEGKEVPSATNGHVSWTARFRPKMHGCQNTDNSINSSSATTDGGVIVGRRGKKKKFPMLRKALGLYD